MENGVQVSGGRDFWKGSGGTLAGIRLLEALGRNEPFTPQVFRTCDTLRRDQWVEFDTVLVEAAALRLRGVADLLAAGLTRFVPNSFGKTVFQYDRIGDISPALVSMDGMVNTENDAPEFDFVGLPLPITHKDFWINLRKLSASRNGTGEALDTVMIRLAGRTIAEKSEEMLFLGGKTFGGLSIYGYTTHPNRATSGFTGGLTWDDATKTGQGYYDDVAVMIAAMEAAGFKSGPYWIYTPSDASIRLDGDFKANSDRTIRERLLTIDRVQRITAVDTLPTNNVVMVQATDDVVTIVNGEPLQTIQWDVNGGMQVNFKALQIQVPLIRVNQSSKTGIVHLS